MKWFTVVPECNKHKEYLFISSQIPLVIGFPTCVNVPLNTHIHTHTFSCTCRRATWVSADFHAWRVALLIPGVRGSFCRLHLREAGPTCAKQITPALTGMRSVAE